MQIEKLFFGKVGSMNVSAISALNSNMTLGAVNSTKKVSQTSLLKQNAPTDTVCFKGRSAEMSDDEKKEMISEARTKAAGWSVFGGLFSTLYYALRSDDTVAKKFDLDPTEDKDLVKRIKKEQVKYTLPGILDLGVLAWLYAKFVAEPKDIKL